MIIPDLREKIDLLEGLLGYAFPRQHFEDKTICRALRLKTEPQWSRKKNGSQPVRPYDLSQLFLHYQLPRPLDQDVFRLPFGEFRTALRRAGVGIYGLEDGHRVRQHWLSDPRCRRDGITCARLPRREARGGFGLDTEDAQRQAACFRVGDRATVQIKIADSGHLLVLNDRLPIGETTCLMPSVLAPTTVVPAGLYRLPRTVPALDVLGPPGWYRLFALWTLTPVPLSWANVEAGKRDPQLLAAEDFTRIQHDLRARRRAREDYAILTTTYQVID